MGLYIDIVRLRHKDEGLDGDDTECCTPLHPAPVFVFISWQVHSWDKMVFFASYLGLVLIISAQLCFIFVKFTRLSDGESGPGSYEVLAWIQVIIL